MNGNFNASALTNLQSNSQKVFDELIVNLRAIQNACADMSSLVVSDDSALASRWTSIGSSLSTPIANADGTFGAIYNLLSQYVSNTIANEESANSQLTAVDEEIQELGAAASQIVDLSSVLGVGAGVAGAGVVAGAAAGAIGGVGNGIANVAKGAVAGVAGGIASSAASGVVSGANDVVNKTLNIRDSAMKSEAPPITLRGEGHSSVSTKYAPPISGYQEGAVTKYAPPISGYQEGTVTKYAPPMSNYHEGTVTKYAPPAVNYHEGTVTKYAPPMSTYHEAVVTKYAPPMITKTSSSSSSSGLISSSGGGAVGSSSVGTLNSTSAFYNSSVK